MAVQFVFPAGSGPGASEADALDPINDNRVEGTETVSLQAGIIAGIGMFVPGANMATVNILDDDGRKLQTSQFYQLAITMLFFYLHM